MDYNYDCQFTLIARKLPVFFCCCFFLLGGDYNHHLSRIEEIIDIIEISCISNYI